MKEITKKLKYQYLALLAAAVIIVSYYEMDFINAGAIDPESVYAYWIEIIGVFLCIVLVPLALKLLSFEKVKQQVIASEQKYLYWCEVRYLMLAASLLFNLWFYYLLGFDTTCGYLSLITAVACLFVWPTQGRAMNERNTAK